MKAIEKAEICATEAYEKAKVTERLDLADDEANYIVSENFQEFKKVHAHRYYQFAICNFKRLRYGQSSNV